MVFYRILKSMGSIPSSPIAIARGLDNTIEAKSLVRRFQSLELVMPLPFLFNSDLTAAGGVDGVDNRENNDDDLASLLSTATTAATESDSNSSSSSSSLMMPSLLSSSTNSPRRQQVITFDATDYQLFWESEFLPDSSVSLSGDQKLIQIVMQRKLVPFSNTSSLSEEDQTQTSFLDRIHGFKTCPSGIYTEVTEVGWNKAVQSGESITYFKFFLIFST